MEVEQYISQEKALYDSLLDFIEADESDTINDTYNILFVHLQRLNNEVNSKETWEFLQLISSISSNYHFTVEFFDKIKKIILFLSNKVKQSFTNRQIFDIFKKNKRVLLFLFEEKIISVDDSIIHFFNSRVNELQIESQSEDHENNIIVKKMKNKNFNYCIFFYPEIKDHVGENMKEMIEEKAKSLDPTIFDNFEEKRKNCENDNDLCEMIRNDSIEDFISYITKYNILVDARLESSVFETNSMLLKSDVSLIEYAAFYGSIQIFQYLLNKGTDYNPSIWLYGIHSGNPEIINIIEKGKFDSSDINFLLCLKEAIKCHHNNIADYITYNYKLNNDIISFSDISLFKENTEAYGIHYHNFLYYPKNLDNKNIFLYFVKFNYINLVDIYLKHKTVDLSYGIIFKKIKIILMKFQKKKKFITLKTSNI